MNRTLPPGDRGHRGCHPRGHPDVEGLCRALADWSRELRLIRRRQPGLKVGKPAAAGAGRAEGIGS
jgi:hypothetical protein